MLAAEGQASEYHQKVLISFSNFRRLPMCKFFPFDGYGFDKQLTAKIISEVPGSR
jgi:hypothetical protein